MSAYEVMAATSEALRTILWDSIRLDPVTRAIVNNEETIVFKNPTETMKDNANQMCIRDRARWDSRVYLTVV